MSSVQPAGIDNLTAIMRLPLLRDEKDLHRLLAGKSPSYEHLMSFMHEVTHHWCFRTGPVGSMMAYLESRAASSAYFAITGANPQQHQKATFDSIARSRGATQILRPLAEGLALFSEFDILSGRDSKVYSQVFMAARSQFINTSDSDLTKALQSGSMDPDEFIDKSDRAMHILLAQERTQARAIDRKNNLLLQPIDPGFGGYLPGYLSVKDLYYRCARNTPVLLTEPDLFLCYIQQYIYSDPVLAAALIDPLADAREALSAFTNRLSARMILLPLTLTEESLEGLQRSSRENDLNGLMHFTGIAEEDYVASWRTISQFIDELKLAAENPEDPIGVLVRALVNQRTYMHIGELSADVRFDEGYAMIDLPSRGTGIRVPVFKTLRTGNANVVHLISPVDREYMPIAALYERDDEVVALSWGIWSKKDQERMTTDLLETRYPVRAARELVKICQEIITGTLKASGSDVELENLMRQITAALQTVYFPIARGPADEADLARIRLRMARRGLGGLVEDPDLVRRLARLGLANSVTRNYRELSIIFERLGWSALDEEITLLVQAAREIWPTGQVDRDIWPIALFLWGDLTGDKFMVCSP